MIWQHGSLAAGLVLTLTLCACAGDTGGAGGGRGAEAPLIGPTTSADPDELYGGFVDCAPLPPPGPDQPPPQMVVPDGTVVTQVMEVGPLVSAVGFVDTTPIELRDAFVARDDVELVYLEDEGFEAEILLDAGDWRSYIKATIHCRTGSQVRLLLARDSEAAALPVPSQQSGQQR